MASVLPTRPSAQSLNTLMIINGAENDPQLKKKNDAEDFLAKHFGFYDN